MTDKESKSFKTMLSYKFGWVCWYCGLNIKYKERHLDHIIPKSKGGEDDPDNLALSCAMCNYAKQAMDLGDFYSWLEHVATSVFNPKIRINEPHPLSSLYQDKEI